MGADSAAGASGGGAGVGGPPLSPLPPHRLSLRGADTGRPVRVRTRPPRVRDLPSATGGAARGAARLAATGAAAAARRRLAPLPTGRPDAAESPPSESAVPAEREERAERDGEPSSSDSESDGIESRMALRAAGPAYGRNMSMRMVTESGEQVHARAAAPAGIQARVAKFVDSAQLYPKLKPAW